MPIHIKGSGGGAQKAPEITVSTSGKITASAGKKTASVTLSSLHDADFIPANIKKGVDIFGVTGTMASYTDIGYTDSYDEHSDCFTADSSARTITIFPDVAKTTYGLSRITGVKNFSICVQAVDGYWMGFFLFTMVNSSRAYGLYAEAEEWEGDTQMSSVENTYSWFGACDCSYDATSGALTIECPVELINLFGVEGSIRAKVTWAID